MSAESLFPAMPATISATLNYLAPTARPTIYSAGPGAPERRVGDHVDPRSMFLADARPVAGSFSIDREGFRLIEHHSTIRDYCDGVRSVFVREAEAIFQRETGATRVVVFDPARRTSASDAQGDARPVLRVHNDFSDVSAQRIVRELLPQDADVLLRNEFAIVQLWQPIRPIESYPLAIADSRTVAESELIVVKRCYPNWEGESHLVVYGSRHTWYWVPRMQPAEALIFKGYDSRQDGRARWGVHTSFEHASDTDVPRLSIEVRALAFFS